MASLIGQADTRGTTCRIVDIYQNCSWHWQEYTLTADRLSITITTVNANYMNIKYPWIKY